MKADLSVASRFSSLKLFWKRYKKWVTWLVTCLALAFIVRYIVLNWSQLSSYSWSIHWGWLGLALLCEVPFFGFQAVNWLALLRWNGVERARGSGFWFWFQSSLARYLPTPIFAAGSRVYFATQLGANPGTASWCFVVEILASVVGAGLISLFGVPQFFKIPIQTGFVVLFILALILILAVVVKSVFPVLKRYRINLQASFSQVAAWFFLYAIIFIFQGLAYLFILKSISSQYTNFVYILGVSSFAWLLGTVNVFAPSGIGTREMILLLGFQNQLPSQEIIYLSLVARLLGTATELLLNGIGFAYLFFEKKNRPGSKVVSQQ
jgi:hypothetical protein